MKTKMQYVITLVLVTLILLSIYACIGYAIYSAILESSGG